MSIVSRLLHLGTQFDRAVDVRAKGRTRSIPDIQGEVLGVVAAHGGWADPFAAALVGEGLKPREAEALAEAAVGFANADAGRERLSYGRAMLTHARTAQRAALKAAQDRMEADAGAAPAVKRSAPPAKSRKTASQSGQADMFGG